MQEPAAYLLNEKDCGAERHRFLSTLGEPSAS